MDHNLAYSTTGYDHFTKPNKAATSSPRCLYNSHPTPSQVRFEVNELLQSHCITNGDRDKLMTLSNNSHVAADIVNACSKIRTAKENQMFNLLSHRDFITTKKKVVSRCSGEVYASNSANKEFHPSNYGRSSG